MTQPWYWYWGDFSSTPFNANYLDWDEPFNAETITTQIAFDITNGEYATSDDLRFFTWPEGVDEQSLNECISDIEFLETTADLKQSRWSVTLQNVNSIAMEYILAIKASPLYFAFSNSQALIYINYPIQVILGEGTLDNIEINDTGEQTSVKLTFTNEMAYLDKPTEVTYTPEDQFLRDSGDKGFEYVSAIESWTGFWGRKKATKKKNNSKTKPKNDRKRK